jgi:hypothetical protein
MSQFFSCQDDVGERGAKREGTKCLCYIRTILYSLININHDPDNFSLN